MIFLLDINGHLTECEVFEPYKSRLYWLSVEINSQKREMDKGNPNARQSEIDWKKKQRAKLAAKIVRKAAYLPVMG